LFVLYTVAILVRVEELRAGKRALDFLYSRMEREAPLPRAAQQAKTRLNRAMGRLSHKVLILEREDSEESVPQGGRRSEDGR
jgi:hypothetical protein